MKRGPNGFVHSLVTLFFRSGKTLQPLSLAVVDGAGGRLGGQKETMDSGTVWSLRHHNPGAVLG
jgi:hypothetical protein